eukprot:3224331-Amphidinium_carterae.2
MQLSFGPCLVGALRNRFGAACWGLGSTRALAPACRPAIGLERCLRQSLGDATCAILRSECSHHTHWTAQWLGLVALHLNFFEEYAEAFGLFRSKL